jgi:hypothetical protein
MAKFLNVEQYGWGLQLDSISYGETQITEPVVGFEDVKRVFIDTSNSTIQLPKKAYNVFYEEL